MDESITDYALRAHLDMSSELALREVVAALKNEGFGALTEVDVQATLKNKLDVDFRSYRILGVCNPPLAFQALSTNLDVGLLLPCNVILYDEGDGTEVAVLDPLLMMGIGDGLGVEDVAEQARLRLQRVIEALANLGRGS